MIRIMPLISDLAMICPSNDGIYPTFMAGSKAESSSNSHHQNNNYNNNNKSPAIQKRMIYSIGALNTG
jgi:hypothetical protein